MAPAWTLAELAPTAVIGRKATIGERAELSAPGRLTDASRLPTWSVFTSTPGSAAKRYADGHRGRDLPRRPGTSPAN
ncbi:hypothetical protein SPURM210S_00788 [Streptomyces purpurascens]